MLESFKKVIGRDNGSSDKKGKSPESKVTGMTSFGGLNKNQIEKQIASGSTGASLSTPKLGEDAKSSLNEYASKDKSPAITVASNASFAEVIATIFSEGEVNDATEKLKEYINQNKGAVDKRFWYMLMDAHQVSNNRPAFEKVALAFANLFGASPPSWQSDEDEDDDKKGMMAGKNIMILEAQLKADQGDKFKEFLKAAKEEKFCRINVSQCKFEQSELPALLQLHKLFVDLRKAKVMSVLMGDNTIINFCKNYINPPENAKLREDFLLQESFFWLIYLEILQWKGKAEEFENLAFEYAVKFEISPPGWDSNGVMLFEKANDDVDTENQKPLLDKVLTYSNIQSLLDIIQNDFKDSTKSEIELAHVERIDFASAGSITHFIMELWSQPEHADKQVIFKHPNEMILTLLEMVGVTEFVTITPKIR